MIALAGPASAAVTLGPAVQPHGPGRVSVMWEEASDHDPIAITLRSPGRPDRTASSQVANGVHVARFENLEPGVEYTYTVGDREGRFMSPPDATQDVRFAVFGDSRSGDSVHRMIVDRVAQARPDFYMTTGDDVANGENIDEWRTFFEIERPLMSTTAFSGVRGNHDVGSLFENLIQIRSSTEGAAPTYGSTDIGPAHFLMVDSESPVTPGTEQYAFIERDLAANESKPLFVLLHRPLYSSGAHGGVRDPEMSQSLAPLFERYGVDLVFQGHDHDYERTNAINGVTYVVTGGAGAPLRGVGRSAWTAVSEASFHYLMIEASATRIRVVASRLDGSQLDAFEVNPSANNGRFTTNEPRPAPGGGGCSVSPQGGHRTAADYAVPGALVASLGLASARRALRRRRQRRAA